MSRTGGCVVGSSIVASRCVRAFCANILVRVSGESVLTLHNVEDPLCAVVCWVNLG
jgi:hypothetical protein